MPIALKRVLQTLLMLVVLFAIALVLRAPALALSGVAFGMHGLFVAPFFGFAAAAFVRRTGTFWPVGVAGLALAAALGMMSPVMGWGNGVPAALALLVWAALGGMRASGDARMLATATVFGGAGFLATTLAGIALGSTAVSGAAIAVNVVLSLASLALALLGGLAGKRFVRECPCGVTVG